MYWLIANVSKGGNFLLNVGPDGSGIIPPKSVENLLEVGKWLEVNGEAIYGTRPWSVVHEGPTDIIIKGTSHRSKSGFIFDFKPEDFWFTKKDNKVYVIALAKPKKNKILLKSFKNISVSKINILGVTKKATWKKKVGGLEITLPNLPNNILGYVLEIS